MLSNSDKRDSFVFMFEKKKHEFNFQKLWMNFKKLWMNFKKFIEFVKMFAIFSLEESLATYLFYAIK